MPQLKSRRKGAETGRPNLQLVPPPKPRRRARRWKLPRSLRGIRRLKYDNHFALHAYEDALLLDALRQRGGYGSVESLMHDQPDRWRRTYLNKVFRRLHRHRRLERLARSHHHWTRYELPRNSR